MTFFDRLREPLERISRTAAPTALPLASPWSGEHPHHLLPAIETEIFGTTRRAISRDDAIQIPALSRARQLIVSTIPRLPLVATAADGSPLDVPEWLRTSSGALSPFHRMLWTIDDLFFYGWSLWAITRDERGSITDAARVPYTMWHFDEQGQVIVNGIAAGEQDVILIPGNGEGILVYGAATLAEAMNISRAIQKAAETPSAQIELHQTNEAPMTQEQIDHLIARWSQARRGENGGVAFTSSGIEVREHGAAKEHLLIEGRNAVAVDVARHAGIPATMIDATLSGSSISYQNTSARMAELITFGLAPLMYAVAARLSQDDVTPPGMTIDFDSTTVIESLRPIDTTDAPDPLHLEDDQHG